MARVDGTRIVAECGRRLSSLAREAATHGLTGLEFGIGIPGSVGGAVTVNAGAEGSDVAGVVESVTVLRRSGEEETWTRDDLQFGYRHSRLLAEPALVLDVMLVLKKGDPEEIRARTQDLLNRRARQPRGRSAGSVFRNPKGDFAGRLLDEAGAKGMRVGGAAVSDRHANFILTDREASASDILLLIKQIQEKVERKTGIVLCPEVMFAGFENDDPRLPRGARVLLPLI